MILRLSDESNTVHTRICAGGWELWFEKEDYFSEEILGNDTVPNKLRRSTAQVQDNRFDKRALNWSTPSSRKSGESQVNHSLVGTPGIGDLSNFKDAFGSGSRTVSLHIRATSSCVRCHRPCSTWPESSGLQICSTSIVETDWTDEEKWNCAKSV